MCANNRCLIVFSLVFCIAPVFSGETPERRKPQPVEKQINPALRAKRPESAELLVLLHDAKSAGKFAADHNLTLRRVLKSDPNAFVFSAQTVDDRKKVQEALKTDTRSRQVFENRRSEKRKLAFSPDDPYFFENSPSGFPGQWHLYNTINPGRDAGVVGAWNRDFTGFGVTIGIIDDSVEKNHPDLAPNFSAGNSYDFLGNDSDPSPVLFDDDHGSSVAGVAAARGGNGIGVTGAAPEANIAGLRIGFGFNADEADFFDATRFHSIGASPAIQIKNHSYGSGPYTVNDIERQGLQQSADAGTIHCFAAGNETDDANRYDPNNSTDGICVAAFGSDGRYSNYSNYGACVFCTAPSSTDAALQITTVDRSGIAGYNDTGISDEDPFPDINYTCTFGGTSSASPLAAGVIALVKQAQPALNVRFIKHLLVKNCTIVDSSDSSASSDGGWKTNAAGNRFNQNYGFGLISADKLTREAVKYTGVSAQTSQTTGALSVNQAIPDNNPTGISKTFTMSGTTPVEDVVITMTFQHAFAGDIKAYVTSPSGTKSRLVDSTTYDVGGSFYFTFLSNVFWGEMPAGTWTLQVADAGAGDAGTWVSYNATVNMGTLNVPLTPQTISFGSISNKTFGNPSFTVNATATSGLPVSFSIFAGPAMVFGNTVTLLGAGTVTVRASQGGNSIYAPAPNVDRTFTVAKANQTLTFPPLSDITFAGQTFQSGAGATSALSIVLSVISGNAAVNGDFITITGIGPVTIRASQPGDANYNPAASVDRTFNVARAAQTIDFPSIADKFFDQSQFLIFTTATSGLPVALSVVSGPATLNGNQVTLIGGGSVTIRASQPGNANYFPAVDVDRTFNVTAEHHPDFLSGPMATPNAAYVSQLIAFSAAYTDLDGDTVTLTWNFGDGTVATGPNVTHKFGTAGTFTVQATLFDGSLTTVRTLSITITMPVSAPVSAGAIKFTFLAQKKDSFTLSGTIPISRGTNLTNTTMNLGLEDFVVSGMKFDAKNTAAFGKTVTFKITAKTDGAGAITDQNAKYSLSIKGETLFEKVKGAGFVNDNVKSATVQLAATFEVGGRFYRALKGYSYTAKLNKTGSGKSLKL